jgi:hypothetical protein
MDVNYRGALIAVAEDCPVEASAVPEPRGGKKTLPLIQLTTRFTIGDASLVKRARRPGSTS